MTYSKNDITAVILAGGRSTRTNGKNKALLPLHGKPLRISAQLDLIIISANTELEQFRESNYPVVEDQDQLYLGPLAGLQSCESFITTPIVMTLPCDTPFIPANLVTRLCDELSKDAAKLQVVNNGRQQNLFMMFHRNLLKSINNYLASGQRSVHGWISLHAVNQVYFHDDDNCFSNINTLEDLQIAHTSNEY